MEPGAPAEMRGLVARLPSALKEVMAGKSRLVLEYPAQWIAAGQERVRPAEATGRCG
jgi:hypothetical protein